MKTDLDFGYGANVRDVCKNGVVPGRFWIRGTDQDGVSNAVFGYFDAKTSPLLLRAIETCVKIASDAKRATTSTLTVSFTPTRYTRFCGYELDVRHFEDQGQTIECNVR